MLKDATQQLIELQQQKGQPCHQRQIENDPERDKTDLSGKENELKRGPNKSLENFDIDRLLCSLTMVIDEQLVTSVGYIFQVNCVGFGDFYVNLKNGSGNCCKGISPGADVTFWLNRDLLFKILGKEITPLKAYLDGSLRIQGSFKATLRLTLLSDRFKCLL